MTKPVAWWERWLAGGLLLALAAWVRQQPLDLLLTVVGIGGVLLLWGVLAYRSARAYPARASKTVRVWLGWRERR